MTEEKKELYDIDYVPVCGVNQTKANVITSYFVNKETMKSIEKTQVVHGELRLQYVGDKLITFVLITENMNGSEHEHADFELGILESYVCTEYYKHSKKQMFLDMKSKELYRISNKPSFERPLGKAIIDEYIWDDETCQIIERPEKAGIH